MQYINKLKLKIVIKKFKNCTNVCVYFIVAMANN